MYSGGKNKHLNFTAHLSPGSYTAQTSEIQLPLMKFLVVFHGLTFKREGKGTESSRNVLVFLSEIY